MTEIKSVQADTLSIARSPAGRTPFWLFLAIGLGVVVLAVLTSHAPRVIQASAIRLHPHAPDLGLFMAAPTVIQVHLLAALAALALGAVMMLSRKGARFHRTAGWVWVSLMALVAGSSLFITGLNGNRWSLIHLLSGWTLISLPLAMIAARRHSVARHRRAMMGLFYGGLVLAGLLAFIPGRLLWNMVLG